MHEQIERLTDKKIKRWTMTQVWEDVLFAHWSFPVEVVRKLVPEQLQIDTFDGKAWIGVVLFRMNGFKLRFVPFRYPFSFPEINLRTYVKVNEEPAIFFITLDAADPLVVSVAKRWYRLPYFRARMSFNKQDETFTFHSERKSVVGPVMIGGEFYPVSERFAPEVGSIDHWLTERYVYFNKAANNDIYWGEVYHEPWRVQKVRGEMRVNTLLHPYHIDLSEKPHLLHYSRGVEAQMGAPARYKTSRR